MVLIDGKKVSAEIRIRLKQETEELKNKTGRTPGLATVLVGKTRLRRFMFATKIKSAMRSAFSPLSKTCLQKLPKHS